MTISRNAIVIMIIYEFNSLIKCALDLSMLKSVIISETSRILYPIVIFFWENFVVRPN